MVDLQRSTVNEKSVRESAIGDGGLRISDSAIKIGGQVRMVDFRFGMAEERSWEFGLRMAEELSRIVKSCQE